MIQKNIEIVHLQKLSRYLPKNLYQNYDTDKSNLMLNLQRSTSSRILHYHHSKKSDQGKLLTICLTERVKYNYTWCILMKNGGDNVFFNVTRSDLFSKQRLKYRVNLGCKDWLAVLKTSIHKLRFNFRLQLPITQEKSFQIHQQQKYGYFHLFSRNWKKIEIYGKQFSIYGNCVGCITP